MFKLKVKQYCVHLHFKVNSLQYTVYTSNCKLYSVQCLNVKFKVYNVQI